MNTTKGNRDYLFNESNTAWGGDEYTNYSVPEEALSDEQFARMLREAEKYLGWPYVWGGSSPSDGGFDCSGYVCWVVNNCGNGWNVGRTTAEGLRRMCAYVSPADARPGDLVFFQGTYNTEGASHVGIYVGNGMMINAGDPIKYANIHSAYWESHFMQFGLLPGANPGTSSGSKEFTEEDRRLLADCIYWEARGQSYECQCYVGQVILNRVYDRRYPNPFVVSSDSRGSMPTESGLRRSPVTRRRTRCSPGRWPCRATSFTRHSFSRDPGYGSISKESTSVTDKKAAAVCYTAAVRGGLSEEKFHGVLECIPHGLNNEVPEVKHVVLSFSCRYSPGISQGFYL